jgi:hypothetical protein
LDISSSPRLFGHWRLKLIAQLRQSGTQGIDRSLSLTAWLSATPSPAVSLGMFGLVTIAAMCGKIDASNVHSIQVKAFDEFDHVMEQYGKDAACEAIKLKLKQAEAKLSKASD